MGYESYEPFHIKTAEDTYTGLDIDLASEIFKRMKCNLKIVPVPWSRQLKDLEEGNLHVMTSASVTEERKVFALFSHPYVTVRNVLVLRKEASKTFKVTKLKDLVTLKKFKLGVTRNYEYGDVFSKAANLPKFKGLVEEANDEDQNIKKLLADRVNGILVNEITFRALVKRDRSKGQFEIFPLDIGKDELHYMFSKKLINKGVVDSFNEALASTKADGTYQKIMDKFLD